MNIMLLSSAQQRVWLEWKLNPQSVAYNNPLLYQLIGNLDVGCLQQALQHIVTEQPALRSYFITQAGLPRQVIESDCCVVLDYHNVTHLSSIEQQTVIDEIITRNCRQPFNLSQLPLFRFSLIQIKSNEYLFILNIHHIVVDGYSAQLLLQSITKYYREFLIKSSPNLCDFNEIYSSYIHDSLQSEIDETEEKKFWQDQFNDATMNIDLFQSDLLPDYSDEGRRDHFSISKELTLKIKQLAKQHKTTDFMILMACFYTVLSKYANQYDLTIGYPLDIRPSACRNLFGFFVNNIPFRVILSPEDTVGSLLQQMNRKRKELKPHQKTDLSQIIRYVRELYPSAPDSLYNVSFIRANFAMTGLEFPDVDVISKPISTNAVKDDLCLLYDEREAFEFEIEFNQHRFTSDYVQYIQAGYIACLEAFCSDSDLLIRDINLYGSAAIPSRGLIFPINEDLTTRFINYASKFKNAPSVITIDQVLTYRQLYDAVANWREIFFNRLSNERPVIVCLPRTPRLLSVLLALQWLEITYIPIDPSISLERIQIIAEDSNAGAIIVDVFDSREFGTLPILCVQLSESECSTPAATKPIKYSSNSIAYIIYTSGSTGKPKGVSVGRRAFNNFLASMARKFLYNETDLFLAITTIGFDIAALELFLPLWQGKTIYLANQAQHKDPFMIAQILSDHPITHMQATPAMWQMLGEIGWNGKAELVALCGGEALAWPLAQQLLAKVGELWNMYGPTEATIWCSLKRILSTNTITIGKPIDNMEMRVLDASNKTLPPYVKGELYIGGFGLSDGYVNNDVLTNAQFMECPDALGGRLYRSGDVACSTPEGEFIVFGRTDNQIKLNGYRIELGEIETRLLTLNGVTESAVIVHQKQILAYVSMESSQAFSEAIIIDALGLYLPDYMVPARCFLMEKLPLTTSGKIDRKALPVPENQSLQSFERPQNESEEAILALWQILLKQEVISVTDHFYRLGGHSLLAAQLTVEINQRFQSQLKFADVLSHPTIRQQARLLQSVAHQHIVDIPRTAMKIAPLTSSQRRIWFVSQLSIDQGQYNMAALMRIKGEVNLEQLKKAIELLSYRQPALRLELIQVDYEPSQRISDNMAVEIESIDADDSLTWQAWAAQSFNLYQAPLWRLGFYQKNSSESVLGIALHHLIADGYSVPYFLNELWSVYDSDVVGDSLPCQYLDFALYEQTKEELAADILFWQKELLNSPYLCLPHDKPTHPQDITLPANYVSFLPEKIWARVRCLCEKSELSVGSFLTGAFAILMHRYSNQTDFCIGLPVANREHPFLKEMIGCFMDFIPLRINFRRMSVLRSWLLDLGMQTRDCLAHNSLSFSSLLSHLKFERNGTNSPLFPVVLNIQSDPFEESYSKSLNVNVSPIYVPASKFDLSLEIYFSENQLKCNWEFSNQLFLLDTIKKMNEEFLEIINAILESPDASIGSHILCATPVDSKLHTLLTQPGESIYSEPSKPLQKMVADVWQRVLKKRQVGLLDHFFRLGGHSFLAAVMISELSASLNRSIPMDFIFRYSKLVDFCDAIEQLTSISDASSSAAPSDILLTSNQRQLFLHSKYVQSNHLQNISVLIELEENIDWGRLEVAFNEEIEQHTIYYWYLPQQNRSVYVLDPLEVEKERAITPHQINPALLATSVSLYFDIINAAEDSDLDVLAGKYNKLPIDIHRAPLLRVVAFCGEKKQALLVTMNHLIGDEWSLHQLMQSTLARYYQDSVNPSYPSRWESFYERWLHPNSQSLVYWQEYLVNNKSQSRILPSLPENAPGESSDHLARCCQRVDSNCVKICNEIAQSQDATLYQVATALFIYLMDMMIADDELTFATTYNRRNSRELQNIHGYLVNLVPLRISRDQIIDFGSLLEWVKSDYLKAIEHVDVDYAHLLEIGCIVNPEVVFNYQHSLALSGRDGSSLNWRGIVQDQAKFSFVFNLKVTSANELDISVDYKSSLYHPELIASIVNTYVKMLRLLPTHQNILFADWPLEENQACSSVSIISDDDLMTIMMDKGKKHKNDIAIQYLNKKITYQMLWADVDKLASVMMTITKSNCLSGEVFAIKLENKYHYIISILATLRVGAAFLGIDSQLPQERQELLISDSRPRLIIHEDKSTSNDTDHRYYAIHDLLNFSEHVNLRAAKIIQNSPAYYIYTSGSTGLPKAVIIENHALLSFISALQNQLKTDSTDRMLQFSSVSFDASIWEIFLALYSGASLCIPSEKERRVGQSLQQFFLSAEITHAILTPTVLNTLSPSALPALKTVVSGGESCSSNLITLWEKHCDFYNAYGPTEATVCVAMNRCVTNIKSSVIGTPLGSAQLWVSSPKRHPLPIGAIGELMIGGPILAQGYLNQTQLTDERFIVVNHERWYCTGDRVRCLRDSQFEYLGRIDRQVKLRGLRIELGEIESALTSISGILSACCLVHQGQLFAYVTAKHDISESDINRHLIQFLPVYLLPNRIIQVNFFPLLPSGKIDPSQLKIPEPRFVSCQRELSEVEFKLRQIWCDSLRLDEVDIESDFFALGGNSLQAMGIAAEVEALYLIEFSIQLFYSHGTIALQSEYISQQMGAQIDEFSFDEILNRLSDVEKIEFLEQLDMQ